MRRIVVFNQVSLDGYIADARGDMSWAHKQDPEWNAFVAGNTTGEGELLFGRITYEMMASFWPTPQAMETLPAVANWMNSAPKVVFSRTLAKVSWNNARLVKHNLSGEVQKLKKGNGPDMLIFGSGTIVAQLAQDSLVDEYQIVVNPIVLGQGNSMFAGVASRPSLTLTSTRTFSNGNVFLVYRSV